MNPVGVMRGAMEVGGGVVVKIKPKENCFQTAVRKK
jgi:hypothetical protein